MTVPLVRVIEDDDIPAAAAALVEVHATDGYPVEGVARPREWITSAAVAQAWVAYARQHELRLVLDVTTKDTGAIRLYERLGWQPIGEATHHYGDAHKTTAVCYVSPPATGAGPYGRGRDARSA
jgi:hypothetical protein